MTRFWTSRAWSDGRRWSNAHGDLFIRNVFAVDGLGDDPAAAEANRFDVGDIDVPWPTLAQVERWEAQNDYPGQSTVAAERLEIALRASIRRVAERCHLRVLPEDPAGGPVLIPADVALATIMLTVRLARRASTPDGIAGSSEIAGLVRTSSMEPDIEALLAPHVHLGLA